MGEILQELRDSMHANTSATTSTQISHSNPIIPPDHTAMESAPTNDRDGDSAAADSSNNAD